MIGHIYHQVIPYAITLCLVLSALHMFLDYAFQALNEVPPVWLDELLVDPRDRNPGYAAILCAASLVIGILWPAILVAAIVFAIREVRARA